MSKKKLIILLIVFSTFLILILNINTIRNTTRNLITLESREKLKEIILGKKTMEYYRHLKNLSNINYNQKLLPNTEFIDISFKEFLLDDLVTNDKHSIKQKYYIEEFYDDLIIVDDSGNIFFIKKDIIQNVENFKSTKVNSNINFKNKLVKDTLVVNNEIYISFSEIASNDCQIMGIIKAKISNEKLNFTNFFRPKECIKLFNTGRMVVFNYNNKNGLLVTTGARGIDKKLAQDDNSLYGKILFIDFKNKNSLVFSKGHRAPQGLLVDNNNIITTEHGPRGGDEINLIKFGKNYGWPIASYGEPTFITKDLQEKNKKIIHYLKNHNENGFAEPIFAFVPSIGISQIIKVPENFSDHWKNSYLIASLAGKVIYRVLFDKDFSKILYYEKILIGKRIRDLIYINDYNVFILALEGYLGPEMSKIPSIGILSLKDSISN